MYSETRVRDALLILKAFCSNQLARFSPSFYVRLTGETGRGQQDASAAEIAQYFITCFRDYFRHLGIEEAHLPPYLDGKTVMEYGPGDILGVALLTYAHGAQFVHCVDRFPLEKLSNKNSEVYKLLLQSLDGPKRKRARSAFNEDGKPESGFKPDAILYSVTANGLSEASRQYDLVFSRAVLEHVNCLEATIRDVSTALRANGVSVHKVDLRSHGLDRYSEFDFLRWPETLYRLMYSHKGFPNRWRVDKYRTLAAECGLRFRLLVPTGMVEQEKIKVIQPRLARSFRHVSTEELSWRGFWMVLERAQERP